MADNQPQHADDVAHAGVVEVRRFRGYCTACPWYGDVVTEVQEARLDAEEHVRERHSDGLDDAGKLGS